MKGPLSADRLFFISSLVFVVSFVIYTALNYLWPLPPEALVPVSGTPATLNTISYILSIAGLVTFVLGLIARKQ